MQRPASPMQTRGLRDNKRKCRFCTQEFTKTEHLERHIRSHTKEKPYGCQQCGKKYGRHDSLLRHIKDQHTACSNNGQGLRTTSALPPGEGLGMPSSSHNDTHAEMVQANPGLSAISDFTALPVEPFPDHEPHHDPNTVGAPWPSTLFKDLLPEANPNLQFEDWLTHDMLVGFLHDWPFVLSNDEMGPAANVATYSNSKPLADLQQTWYTHLENDNPAVSGYATPLPRHNEVDDNYRQSLHRRLQIRSLDEKLPSADFLNLCVRYYFKRFHHIFPVIHAPTFRPSKTNSVLLLSICSIGSLLTGYPSAIQRGIQLFERLHKAILAHWDKLMRHGPDETLAMIQASLLGQTFGLLSGQANHLVLVDAFHGTVISWARRARIFQTQHTDLPTHQDLESSWRSWVRTEEKIRVALGLRIHDAEIANLLHHETLLPCASKVSHAASDALFFASSSQEWISLYQENVTYPSPTNSEASRGFAFPESLHQRLLSIPGHCHFSIYAALEDISSAIIEARINESLNAAFIDKVQQCLIASYRQHLHESQFEPLRSGGKIIWHFLFISLHSDLDLLERSIGRDGLDLDASDLSRIHEWANSSSARRCVAHAVKIKATLESFPLTSEPAIHVPRAIFSSAICLLCYSKYGGGARDVSADFPEFELLDADITSLLREAKSLSSADVEIGLICGLVDLLQRIGHWEISRTFASILGVLLQAESG